jgi:hypothetical protein
MPPKKNKKEIKTGNPAPPAQKPQGKGGKTCLTCGIVAAVVVVLLVGGFIVLNILRFWLPSSFLLGFLSQIPGIENMNGTSGTGIKKKQPAPNMGKAVKKMITAEDGGTIEVTTEDGLTVTVVIPPGSLEEDTEVVVAPNEPDPYDPNGADTSEDPGVTVGPPGTTFDPPATITFSFVPTQLTGSVVPDAGSGGSQSGSSGRNNGSSRRFPDNAVIVITSAGASNPVPTEHSDDDSAISGPVGGSGSVEPENPTEDEAEDMAETAAANSDGTCSPEFLQAMAGAANSGEPGSQAARSALRDCFNTEWLNNLCVNNPVKLRRLYFEQRIALARRFDAQAAVEIESLMNQCQAKYHFRGEGISPSSGSGITLFSSLDATVCGYIDDEWTANETYQLNVGPGTYHTIQGTGQFSLPANGGTFAGSVKGHDAMAIGGQGVAIPDFDAGFYGQFDGAKTIQNLYLVPAGVNISSAPIELTEKPCVPLAPLPGGSNR